MTYIKKKYRRLLSLADEKFIIPSCFERFIKEKEQTHNLIIKSKNSKCYCTNCDYHFISKVKVNDEIKCPNCKQTLLVKTDRLQQCEFKDNLQLLDRIEDTFILRTFELYSTYNQFHTTHKITEYMRTIIDNNEIKDFVTNQVHNHMGYMYIAHYQEFEYWRGRNYRWAYRDVQGMVCPYNLKRLLKNTDLKYSQLDKFVAKMSYIDFIYYFTRLAYYHSFEMLVKLKLYNLAREADSFNSGKTFKEIFGVPKTFYSFMKRNNIDRQELEVLKIIQKEDIKLIDKLKRINNLKELSNYVDLEKAYKKVLSVDYNSEYEYLDYLKACVRLEYDMKNSRVLYPKNLKEAHDKAINLLKLVLNESNDKLIKERAKLLDKFTYNDKKYVVFAANSVESLLDESKQQNNCVKTYIDDYALAETDIYFMREIEHKEKSLVTIEVKNNRVVQCRIKDNYLPNTEQMNFINKWAKNKMIYSNNSYIR